MFKLIKLIPNKTNFNIIKYNKIFILFSTIFMLASVYLLATKSFNYGIDFAGGVLVEIKTTEPTNIEILRQKLKSFSPEIQEEGDTKNLFSIHLPQKNKTDAETTAMLANVKKILGEKIEYRNTQIVGPKVSGELIYDSIIAITLVLFVISLYIWLRFELPFAIGAGLSLLHDILLALGMLLITKLEFNLTTLASLLTLVGYSINDTVVIYDRIRENIKLHKSQPIEEIINFSINETFSRTILTSITTFLAVLTIFLFGGEVLRGFSGVMLFGIIAGTYSSTFLSTSSLIIFNKKLNK